MKNALKLGIHLAILLIGLQNVSAQKKIQSFTVSHIIDAPAEKVWAVVGEDYGAVAKSHPKIISSNYINGSLNAGEGAERVCHFNEKGTRFLKEKQVNYDPANKTFKNQVFQAGKFPVNPEYTFAIYKIEAIDANSSRFTFEMNYRTNPAFMGGMMKSSFKKLIRDYATSINHHLQTGELVNKDNFKAIKKQYSK